MRKLIMISLIMICIGFYFVMVLGVIPEKFVTKKAFDPKPVLQIGITNSSISLEESVKLEISSKNIGDPADIFIVSIAFPNLQKITDEIKIIDYDFTNSPKYFLVGDSLGANYSGGIQTIQAKYPSIEAMSRPANTNQEFRMTLEIIPKEIGEFAVFVKSIGIPHTSGKSHYPSTGILDHQNEFVEVYSITVNP